jgi:hypothetical protein
MPRRVQGTCRRVPGTGLTHYFRSTPDRDDPRERSGGAAGADRGPASSVPQARLLPALRESVLRNVDTPR